MLRLIPNLREEPNALVDVVAEAAASGFRASGVYGKFVFRDNPFAAFGQEVFGAHYTDDVRRVMQSVWDHPITIAKSANATGKTYAAADIAHAFYKIFPDAEVWTTAAPPESNLRKLLWGEIQARVHEHAEVFKGDKITSLSITNREKHLIAGQAVPSAADDAEVTARFSGKHAPHLLFIVDEGDAIPQAVYDAIESCMSGGTFARLLVLFNPRTENSPLYRMERDGGANVITLSAFDHPNVQTGEDVIPGAVTREATVRRINAWSRPLAKGETPDAECFEVPAFLVGAIAKSNAGEEYPPLPAGWRKITNSALCYMVLARYPLQGESQLISRAKVQECVERFRAWVAKYGEEPPELVLPVQGLDVADRGPDFNVSTLRYTDFVAMPESWEGVDTLVTGDRAARIHKLSHAMATFIDATGVGVGVGPQMRRQRVPDAQVYEVWVASPPTYKTEEGTFANMRAQLWWSAMLWIHNNPRAMIPPAERLIQELVTPTYEINARGEIVVMDTPTMKEILGHSPDFASSFVLTFYNERFEYQDRGGAFEQTLKSRGVSPDGGARARRLEKKYKRRERR